MIRCLTLNFPSSNHSCSTEILPNLLEWLKPHYKQRVSDAIERKVNNFKKSLISPYNEELQVKLLSPFPGTSLLLAKAVTLTPIPVRDNNVQFDEDETGDFLELVLGNLHAR